MIAVLLLSLVLAQEPPEASELFKQRQEDLVAMAGRLGSLHRLSQVCGGYRDMTLFRDNMLAIVEGERPHAATREAMIKAFNTRYSETADLHSSCSRDAEYALREEALAALAITERLSRGMPPET